MKATHLFLAAVAVLSLSAFDFSRHGIPVEEIESGGPPKDGIPAISNPKFTTSAEASKVLLKENDRVLGVSLNGQAKAYPIKILNWHEIVNDKLGGKSLAVTFCPLCGTGMVFDADVNGMTFTFGVSGLLYQSDMLLYDRQTESLWSQIKSEAVTGKMTGTKLKLLPSTQTTWKAWRKSHPQTLVLSDETGYRRDYGRDPYQGYYESRDTMFAVKNRSNAYHPKERVIGIEIGGKAKVYPFSELEKENRAVEDILGGVPILVTYDAASSTVVIRDRNGKELSAVVGFWFAWYAFHPDTEIFQGRGR